MRASATHHYYIVVPSALQRRGAGSGRGGFTSSARASLQFPKLPQLLGAGEPPAPASAERDTPPHHNPVPTAAPSRSPRGAADPSPKVPGSRDGSLRSPGIGRPERGRRVGREHCSPIKQLTGKRMERPPPPWLPNPAETGKETGTEMPFSLLPPQSQRRFAMKEYIGACSKLPLPVPIHRQSRIGSLPSQASPP